jgi:hypothetical protein
MEYRVKGSPKFEWPHLKSPPTVERFLCQFHCLLDHRDFARTKSADGDFCAAFEYDAWTNKTKASISLYCYPLGPTRQYQWFADTLSEALLKAWNDMAEMVVEDYRLDDAEELV